MNVRQTTLEGVLVLEPQAFGDSRGYLIEQFQLPRYAEIGVDRVMQINHSRSRCGAIRGLHYQEPQPQGKLVWAARGALYDVAVDIRVGSPTFGRWTAAELSEANHLQMWIPPGFAHGFCVLSDEVDCYYACTDIYAPMYGHAIAWNDPDLAIDWPTNQPVLSDKDRAAPRLKDATVLPRYA